MGITGICFWLARRKRYLFFTIWLYYLITLLPVVGIVQIGIQGAADRYTYLPSLSILLLAGIGVSWLFERLTLLKQKSAVAGLCVILICVFIALTQLTIKQIKVWRNSETLWTYVTNAFPKRIWFAHSNLGNAYKTGGRLDEAISEYKRALAIKPNYAKAQYNLGIAYYSKEQFELAIVHLEKAWRLGYSIKPELLRFIKSYR